MEKLKNIIASSLEQGGAVAPAKLRKKTQCGETQFGSTRRRAFTAYCDTADDFKKSSSTSRIEQAAGRGCERNFRRRRSIGCRSSIGCRKTDIDGKGCHNSEAGESRATKFDKGESAW